MAFPVTAGQLALVIWSVAAIAWTPFNRGVRGSTWGLLKTALDPKLLVPAILSLAWNAGVVYGLYRAGLWDTSLWWDTATFMFVGTTSLVWRTVGSDDYSRQFYTRIIVQTLGISVLVGTVASTYTFSLPIELLLVPWLVLLGGLQAAGDSNAENKSVSSLVKFLIAVTGLAMLARAIAGAAADYQGFMSVQTVRSLVLLFVLTLAYIPYLFLFRVWAAYDTAFIPLRLGKDKPPSVHAYARLRMILRFGRVFLASNDSVLAPATTCVGRQRELRSTRFSMTQLVARAQRGVGVPAWARHLDTKVRAYFSRSEKGLAR